MSQVKCVPGQPCPNCGGIHWGSLYCPYSIEQQAGATASSEPTREVPLANPCEICGRNNARQWIADSSLWELLAKDRIQVCADCFDRLAEQRGLILFWQARISKHSLEEHPQLQPLAKAECKCENVSIEAGDATWPDKDTTKCPIHGAVPATAQLSEEQVMQAHGDLDYLTSVDWPAVTESLNALLRNQPAGTEENK